MINLVMTVIMSIILLTMLIIAFKKKLMTLTILNIFALLIYIITHWNTFFGIYLYLANK